MTGAALLTAEPNDQGMVKQGDSEVKLASASIKKLFPWCQGRRDFKELTLPMADGKSKRRKWGNS
jgi:hypothetical protein